jgi:hypothetical protein
MPLGPPARPGSCNYQETLPYLRADKKASSISEEVRKMKSVVKVLIILALGIMVWLPSAAFAINATFTSETVFLNYLQSGYYLNDFNSLPLGPQPIANPQAFSGNGFNYQIDAVTGLYSGEEYAGSNNPGITTVNSDDPLVVSNFTGKTVTAAGGFFYPGTFLGYDTSGKINVSFNGNPPIQLDIIGPRLFLGFVSDTPITSISIDNNGAPFDTNFSSIDHLYVGQQVPLPPSALLLGSGLIGLLGWRRMRQS